MKIRLRFWETWDDRQKENSIKGVGICIGLIALLTLLSTVSYLFTWKQDQSLLRDPAMMDAAVKAANLGGKLGLKWADLLMCKWFGLGSFALIIPMAAISVRLVAGRYRRSLLKTILVTLSGAFVASLICAAVGFLFKLDNTLGSGLGGACGSYLFGSTQNLIGLPLTIMAIMAISVGWLILCSKRFAQWFSTLGKNSPEEEKRAEEIQEEEPVKEAEEVKKPVETIADRFRRKLKKQNTDEDTEAKEQHCEEAAAESVMPVEAPAQPAFTHAVQHPAVSVQVKPEPIPQAVAQEPSESHTPEESPAASDTETEEAGSFEIERGHELDTEIKKELPRIDIRLDPPDGLPNYVFPELDLLGDHKEANKVVSEEELSRNNNKIRSTLRNYKIEVLDVKAIVGPTVTLYKVYPAPGVKIATIKSLQDDIAMSLNARGVRIVTLPDSVGIEVANDSPSIVPLKALLNDDAFRNSKAELPVAIGCNIQKEVRVFDLADAPHLLVAGATKQGKSVGLNVLIASLLYSKHPSEMKMVFVDPKMVEFTPYGRMLKHYLAVLPDAADEDEERDMAIVKKPKEAEKTLRSLCIEMDERYELLSKAFVNNVKLYNEKYKNRKLNPENGHRFMPYLVVIIDEYADLAMSGGSGSEGRAMQKSIMGSIVRLAQKGRAAGIHVVIATQRPSVDVITGLIKANFPARIAFRVSTRVDSNTILDNTGAEKLIGRGDMLYYAGVETERIQCGFISNDEINAITEFIGDQTGYRKCYNTPYYLPSPDPAEGEGGGGMIDMKDLDERFEEAARMVVMSQKGSTSDLQRRLGMGYAKAGRVMDQLEAAGIVGAQEGSKPRQVLISNMDELDTILKAFLK